MVSIFDIWLACIQIIILLFFHHVKKKKEIRIFFFWGGGGGGRGFWVSELEDRINQDDRHQFLRAYGLMG